MPYSIQVQHYLRKFSLEADTFFQKWNFLEIRYHFFQEFKRKSFLENASWPDFQALGPNLHAFTSVALAGANALGNPNHPIEYYRDEFIHLLYSDEPLDKRFDRFEKQVKYFGAASISEILQWCFPEQLLTMNERTTKTVNILGVVINDTRGSKSGEKFIRFNEAIKPLVQAYIDLVGLRTSTTVYAEFDAFCFWLTENIDILPKPPVLPSLPKGIRFWLIASGKNTEEWDNFQKDFVISIGWSEIGDLKQYQTKEKIANKIIEIYGGETNRRNDSLACWQFVHEMKIGDVVIVKKGLTHYLGWGIIKGDYHFDKDVSSEYKNRRSVDWKVKGLFQEESKPQLSMKTLTELTDYTDYVSRLMLLLFIEVDDSGRLKLKPTVVNDRNYPIEQALIDSHLPIEKFRQLIKLLDQKKQIVIQGAPGTGKSYLAKILQRYLTDGSKDQSEIIQFHPSYAYEDFVEGYRPIEGGGATLHSGIFKVFCEKASISEKSHDGKKYVLLIDEVNRGNLTKIFGELLYLLEYRDEKIKLTYRPEVDFHIPSNLYMIGTMNTADRSLALIDYALRRRFSFKTLKTDYLLISRQLVEGFSIETLVDNIKAINQYIIRDISLGEGFSIGHSYFVNARLPSPIDKETLSDIWEFDLEPLLEEYFIDDKDKVKYLKDIFFKGL